MKDGWTYFLSPQWGSHTPRDLPCPYGSSESGNPNDACCTVLSASARVSCGQPAMGSLSGVSMLHQLLCCLWHPSRHDLDGCPRNELFRSFLMIHVIFGLGVEPPPCGAPCCVDCDLGPNLELCTDTDTAEPYSDIQGQRRTASYRSAGS